MIKYTLALLAVVCAVAPKTALAGPDDDWLIQLRLEDLTSHKSSTVSLGTLTGASDDYLAAEDPAAADNVAGSPLLELQQQWFYYHSATSRDVRAPLQPGETKTWRVMMLGTGLGNNVRLTGWNLAEYDLGPGITVKVYECDYMDNTDPMNPIFYPPKRLLWQVNPAENGSQGYAQMTFDKTLLTGEFPLEGDGILVVAQAVPEPASVLALSSMLLGLACHRFRRGR